MESLLLKPRKFCKEESEKHSFQEIRDLKSLYNYASSDWHSQMQTLTESGTQYVFLLLFTSLSLICSTATYLHKQPMPTSLTIKDQAFQKMPED
jgi:hypothetical protein